MADRGIDPIIRARVLLRHGVRCAQCGASDCALEMGHLIPRSHAERLGLRPTNLDDQRNLVPLCRPCNAAMGATTAPEWLCLRAWARWGDNPHALAFWLDLHKESRCLT